MKTRTFYIMMAIMAIAIIYLFVRPGNDEMDWNSRVQHYEHVSDSLQKSLIQVVEKTKEKDSLMLLYMVSIDKTLEELNKEGRKNMNVINQNAQRQDSLISKYCQDMLALDQTPDVCK